MNAEVLQAPQLSTGRLLLLGVSSVILCLGFYTAVFAPFPLALAAVIYGRKKGYLVGLGGLVLCFAVSNALFSDLTLFVFYFAVCLLAVCISEILTREVSPVKGMLATGLGFVALVFLSLGTFSGFKVKNLEAFMMTQIEKQMDKINEAKTLLEQSSSEDAISTLHLLDNPQLIVKEITESFPSFLFMGVFLMIWVNLFLALKSRRLLMPAEDHAHSEKNLLNFKVPFEFVILLAGGLILAVWGEQWGKSWETLGFTIIRCMGVFYFFQGFGVFTELLNFLGMFGFFRTLIVMVTVLTGNYLIAAAGLFDNWFDFRKYFVKRKTDE